MNRIAFFICIGLIALILSGCWDSQLLTTKKIVNGISFDAGENQKFLGAVRTVILESKGGGQFDVKDEFKQAEGASPSIIASRIDTMLPGTVEISKTHVVILGDTLAKKDIFSPLEAIIRNPKGYLQSHLLISKGKASEILAYRKIENNPVAFGIKQILDGAEHSTLVQDQTIYSVWSQVYDSGGDLVVPLVRKLNESALVIDGIALMQGSRYSGVSLIGEDATLLLLMNGKLGKIASLNIPVQQNLVTFQVRKLKQKLKVSVNQRTSAVECTVKVELYGAIQYYPSELGIDIDREQLSKKIVASINAQAAEVIRQMLQANCDALGIGRHLSIHYPRLWKKMNWKDKYKEANVKPDFRIHIQSTGLLN
ncbi:Ger(x)C family spore germination protein [Paenibacillus sp. OV219]|uniref:Ger(x)C family spore germination protein n=1 Tax=Paenibacillus sp. OV219 TaxID=1884377 RepID=UPI0008AEC8A4|nr:Ger(x)C family spore germination protein [Paenibacillus sp. OV219]SEM56506.1 germination protein, Ger(x)C family [Paenibacillus sp. OV219]